MSDLNQLDVAEAERFLLGAALSGYRDLDGLADVVEPGDFYRPQHEEIWNAILRTHAAGASPDAASVRLALGDSRVEPTTLLDYASEVPMVGSAHYYAEQVATAAGLRRIAAAGIKVQQVGQTLTELDHAREEARAAVDEATRGRQVSQARTFADVLPDVIDQAQNGQAATLSTPWEDLDRFLGGVAPGRLVVFGARPGVGKSVVGINLALHMAVRHQHAVLLSSLEMSEQEVGQRLLAAHSQVDLGRMQRGEVDERTWSRIAAGDVTNVGSLITIDDTPGQTLTHIRRAARDVQRRRDDLALVVVDYLQLMSSAESKRDRNRVGELTEISRGLKLLARETGACVVAMAQLSREATKHSDGKPKLTDLRESGSIENDADQVVLLHVPDEEAPDLEFIVGKNRHGPKGFAIVQRRYQYAQLKSAQWSPTAGIA